jgi:hypothetical protein
MLFYGYRRFEELHSILRMFTDVSLTTLKMEGRRCSETLMFLYQRKWRHTPQNGNFLGNFCLPISSVRSSGKRTVVLSVY